MAGRGNRHDLYLQVSGDVSGLRTALTAGKTVLNDFSGAAINVIEEVEKELAKVGTSGLPGLKQTERAYQDTFRRIADSARNAANAPSDQVAAQILDANATREAAAAATAKAQSLRILAEAAGRADQATGGNSAATRAYAVAAATAAVNAEQEADALREQLAVLQAVERELGVNTAAHRKQVAVSGEARAGYQQLSYNLGDIATQYAAGTSASIIFAQQSGQVIQAISLINGEAKGLIGFLSGPWGIAIGAALVAMTPWVAKLLEGNDALGKAIDKLKEDAEQSEISRRAKDRFAKSAEGVAQAIRESTEATRQSIEAEKTAAERANIAAKNNLAEEISIRNKTKARLADAKAELEIAVQRATGGNTRSDIAALGLSDKKANITDLEAQIKTQDALIEEAERRVQKTRADLAEEAAKRMADPIERINKYYNDQVIAAKEAATASGNVTAALTKQIGAINQRRAAALKEEQDRQAAQKRSESDTRNGRFTPKEIGGLLTDKYGGTITSTTGGKHVNGSFHYRGQAVDFVPRGGMGSVSKEEIRAYLQSQGVDIQELLGPGDKNHNDHFHVAFGKTRRGSDAITRSAESAEDRQTRNDDAYASLLSRVKDQQLRIEQSRLVSISEIAANDRQQVDLARDDINRAADKGVALRQWTEAEAEAAKLIAAQNAEREKAGITEREQVALRQQALDTEIAQLDAQAELLQLQDQLAGTSKERRRIALQLLEIEGKQARAAIQRQLVGEKDPARRAQLEADYRQQAASEPYRREILERQNASPLERYRQDLADFDIDDELQTAEVRFFESLNDELGESATRFLKLKGVAGDFFNQLIADVIRLQVKQALFGNGGGLLGGLLKLVGGASGAGGLGGVSVEASSAIADQAAALELRNLRGFSIGGWTGHGRGKVKGVVHGDEYIFDADSTARIGVGTLDALRAGTLTSQVPAIPSVAAAERALASAPAFVRIEVGAGQLFEPTIASVAGNVSAQVAASTAPVMIGAASGDAQASLARKARRQIR
nr:phage tail length tape measure family protein [Sphingobium sp.]